MNSEEIRKYLEEIKQGVEEIKEDLRNKATHEDVMHVADTLTTITEHVAVSLEDKREAGDVLLKSLIDGLENRLTERFDRLENTLNERFIFLSQQIESLAGSVGTLGEAVKTGFNHTNEQFGQVSKIMESWVEKQKMVDNELRFHLQRIVNSEKKTEEIERRVKDLESGR
jgi:polyhydroxyalkanoate synthesis regulator phasin